MAYEIEKRSKLTKNQYARLQSYLDGYAKFINEKRLDSYLFRKPSYLRIRVIDSDPYVYITEKSGTYADIARFEKESKIRKSDINKYVDRLMKNGFNRCVPVITYRRTYLLDGLKVELNKISHLGLIVEIEAMTAKKADFSKLALQVNAMLDRLKLKELPAETYQKMLDYTYANYLIDIKKVSFNK